MFMVEYEFAQEIYDNTTIIEGIIQRQSVITGVEKEDFGPENDWQFLVNDIWDKTHIKKQ
jgi:hypothetical protein